MNTGKSTVPLTENGKPVFDISREYRNRNSKRMLIFAGVIFFIINTFLFIITVVAFTRVKTLENEVEVLKNSVKHIKSEDNRFLQSLLGVDDVTLYDDNEDEEIDPDSFIGLDDLVNDEYVDYYDLITPNETNNLKTDGNNIPENIKMATNLSKDGKESRTKRSVLAATQDGIIINSESYAERKAINNSVRQHIPQRYSITPIPARPSSFGSPSDNALLPEDSLVRTTSGNIKLPNRDRPLVYTRRSRVMHLEERSKAFREALRKRLLKSGDTTSDEEATTSSPDFVIIRDPRRRRHRQRLTLETLDENRTRIGRIKLPATHYSGDTSKYVVGQHTNFNGNGHLSHPRRTFIDWKVSDWTTSGGMDSYFSMEEGVLTVMETGVYFIYAQIYYLDEHDTTGFRVYKNKDTTILQCTITIHARERKLIGNTCYTAGLEYLSEGDTISLGDITSDRYSLFEPGKSFFGLIRISDMKIK